MSPSPETPSSVPLQLDDFYLLKLHVDWVPFPHDGTFEVKSMNLRFTYDLKNHADQKNMYQMTLRVEGEGLCEEAPGCGPNFKAAIVGEYHIEKAENADQEAKLARINGVSLLYSTLRGIVGSASGLLQHGRIVLPSIDPRAIVVNVETARARKEGLIPLEDASVGEATTSATPN